MTDGNRGLAEQLRDELLDRAWVEREAFVYKIEPLGEALGTRQGDAGAVAGPGADRAARPLRQLRLGRHDGHDVVLGEIFKAGLENVAAFAIYDPDAVQQAIAAGIGARVTLVGRRQARDAANSRRQPAVGRSTGTVKTIANGRFRNKGPMGRGVLTDMGPSVVIDTGKVEVALISRHVEPSDLNCFYSLGIDPLQKRYVMLKSRVHWRAGLGAMAKAVVDCAGIGVCTSDYVAQLQERATPDLSRSTCRTGKGQASGKTSCRFSVIPAKAGTHAFRDMIPAFAGVVKSQHIVRGETMDGTTQLLETDRQFLVHPLHHPDDHRRRWLSITARARCCATSTAASISTGSSGLWNVNIGHGRGELADAAAAQMRRIAFASAYIGGDQRAGDPARREDRRPCLCEQLRRCISPPPAPSSNESAFKFARYYWKLKDKPQKTKIISRFHAYHGVTMAAMSATGMAALPQDVRAAGARLRPGAAALRLSLGRATRSPASPPPRRSRRRSSPRARTRSRRSSPSR